MPESGEQPLFCAVLHPHRSLTKSGYIFLMVLFASMCLSTGVFYYSLGAWPVVFFLFVDIAIFWFAFQMSYRSGRVSEEVQLTRTALTIVKKTPAGKTRRHTYNPFWARFQIKRDDARGIIDMRIVGEGYQSTLGAFLNPDDKESFATAFGHALANAKR